MGFPGGSEVNNPPVIQERQIQSSCWDDFLRRKWKPTPVFLPGKSHDRGAWWATVHEVISWTQLSD